VRGTVRIDSGRGSEIKGIGDLREASVESQVTRELNGAFDFETISPAGTFEFKGAIIWDIDLLIGLVNEKQVGGQGKIPPVVGSSNLVKIRRRNLWS
jgi:hypothetical protein